MSQLQFNEPSKIDMDILNRLRAWLNIEAKTTFTADDLYRLGLVQLLPEPHNRTVGAWFRSMQQNRLIVPTGQRVASNRSPNNGRSIKVYTFPKGEVNSC
jgi:hypothetical protein